MVTHAILLRMHRIDQTLDGILDDPALSHYEGFNINRPDLEKLHELIKIVITDQLQGE